MKSKPRRRLPDREALIEAERARALVELGHLGLHGKKNKGRQRPGRTPVCQACGGPKPCGGGLHP